MARQKIRPAGTKPEIEPAVYSISYVADYLGIHLGTAYRLARQPDFPSIRVGRLVLVPKAEFHAWFERMASRWCGNVAEG